jgi:uncharacterized membrane protein YdjX (TVP38/TMEM64 family)
LNVYSYARQVRAVIMIELALVVIALFIAFIFWTNVCDSALESCLADGSIAKPVTFILLSAIRPLVFTPFLFVAMIGGKAFGTIGGTILTAFGAVLSCMVVFGLSKFLGRKLAKPWLRANLPATFKFIRSQDYKLVFAARLVPVLPFDLVSFACGAFDFRFRSVAIATFIGVLPEAYVYSKLLDPSETVLSSTLTTIMTFGMLIILPLLFMEYRSRKKGTGMWQLLKAMYREITYEVQANNEIVKRAHFDPDKTPVLLLYGFFSSRRSVTVLERMLTARGHQVLSFNLGGLLGTFFTRDILETASFIDYKLKRQFDRHGFRKVHVVAHSKGGMVALWWALKLGGHKYCDTIITMGTPYKGTRLTYLALVTPLGFIWRDMGQMRPGSNFIKSLRDLEIPDHLTVHCLHSVKDKVARGTDGVLKSNKYSQRIVPVPMHHIGHFEFLYRRDVGEKISEILRHSDGLKDKAVTRDAEPADPDDTPSVPPQIVSK